jgi:hypothetical protein
MKEVYICLLFIIGAAYILSGYYRPFFIKSYEGFNVSMCQKDSNCPAKFKCRHRMCIDTRPKGVIQITQIERAPVPKNLR